MNIALKAFLSVIAGFSAVLIADRIMGKITDMWLFSKIGPWKR